MVALRREGEQLHEPPAGFDEALREFRLHAANLGDGAPTTVSARARCAWLASQG